MEQFEDTEQGDGSDAMAQILQCSLGKRTNNDSTSETIV